MAESKGIYRCNVCGNIVFVANDGGGTLSCCNEDMELLKANSTDAAQEKHVPVIEKTDTGYKVTVGSVPHPMEDKHYIQWIEHIADGVSYWKFLKPGDAPEAEFCIQAESVTAREYCNLHGLWTNAS